MLESPFERGETFVREFDRAFVAVNQAGFRAILHTGVVGPERADEGVPAGFGGAGEPATVAAEQTLAYTVAPVSQP